MSLSREPFGEMEAAVKVSLSVTRLSGGFWRENSSFETLWSRWMGAIITDSRIIYQPTLLPAQRCSSWDASPMRFWLLDRICSFEPDIELTAVKNVSLAEEYLADHFPEFPVLPGVFMLEAATQAGAWLVRLSENYAHSIVVLHEARAIKYADFVIPGNTLKMHVKQIKQDRRFVSMRFQGEVDGRVSVNGRLVLERYNLADANPDQADLDSKIVETLRTTELLLTRGTNVAAVVA